MRAQQHTLVVRTKHKRREKEHAVSWRSDGRAKVDGIEGRLVHIRYRGRLVLHNPNGRRERLDLGQITGIRLSRRGPWLH